MPPGSSSSRAADGASVPRRVPDVPITAHGMREGDPRVLAALVARRGGDVVAYTTEVAPAGGALRAAVAAFAEFRIALLTHEDGAFDPRVELLDATRRAASRHAENPYRPDDHPRPASRTAVCERMPRLLTSWAAGRLPREDELRLLAHTRECADCHALNRAFARAETCFRDGPAAVLTPAESGALVVGMALASAG